MTNLKHLFIQNLLSVVFIYTLTLINLTRSHWFSLCYFAVILFARTTHYPTLFFKHRLYVPKQVYLTAPKKELLLILPLLRTLSSSLKRKLQTSIPESLPQGNIKVILKSTNHLLCFFCFKDVIPKELTPHTVWWTCWFIFFNWK